MSPNHSTERSLESNPPREKDSSIAQVEQHEKESYDTVCPPSVVKALSLEKFISRNIFLGNLARAETWDSGYGSNESLVGLNATVGTTKTGCSLASVVTADTKGAIGFDRLASEQPQQSKHQERPSTRNFERHQMLPFLKWLEQNVGWPFPREQEVVSLARLSRLTVSQANSWLSWSQQRLLQHAIDHFNQQSVVQRLQYEQDVLSSSANVPTRPQTYSSNMVKAPSATRPKLARPWRSDLLHYSRQKLKQIRKPDNFPLAYAAPPERGPPHSIAAILVGSTAALTLPLSVPNEHINLCSQSTIIQDKSRLPTRSKRPSQHAIRTSSLNLRETSSILVQSDSTTASQFKTYDATQEDQTISIDHWLAELVACNSEDVNATFRRWPVTCDADRCREDIVEKSAIESLSTHQPMDVDDVDETNFHSLRIDEQSSPHLVCTRSIGNQANSLQNLEPQLPPSPVSLSEHCHEYQLDSAVSDTTSCRSDIGEGIHQMDLWTREQELYLDWAWHNSIPLIVHDLNSNLKSSSSFCSSSSVRTCATGEAGYGHQYDTAENPSLLSPGDGTGGNKRKRGKSDDGRRPSKGPLLSAQDLSKSSGDGSCHKFWACPYHKHDRHLYSSLEKRYKSCASGFDGINRLKEHLKRVHSPQYYCFRCKKIFKVQDDKNMHDSTLERCAERSSVEFSKMIIDEEKKKALRKKQANTGSDEQEWYRMWDHLFTPCHHPASPYQDLLPEMREFRAHGEWLLPSIIQHFRTHRPQWRDVPDTALADFHRYSIEYFAGDVELHRRLPTHATYEAPVSNVGVAGHADASPSFSDGFSEAPWSPGIPQASGAPAQQVLNYAIANFPANLAQPTTSSVDFPNISVAAVESFHDISDEYPVDPNLIFNGNWSEFEVSSVEHDSSWHSSSVNGMPHMKGQ